jgi:hypothetical protein
MTFKSKIYLAVIIFSLLFLTAVKTVRYIYRANPDPQRARLEAQEHNAYLLRKQITEEDFPPIDELEETYQNDADGETGYRAMIKPVVRKSDGKLFEEKVERYYRDPAMRAFNRDIQAAVGDISFEDFLNSDFHGRYLNNPQIQKILLQYSKDPAFMNLMRQMVSDPAFMSEAMKQAQNSAPDTDTNDK